MREQTEHRPIRSAIIADCIKSFWRYKRDYHTALARYESDKSGGMKWYNLELAMSSYRMMKANAKQAREMAQ